MGKGVHQGEGAMIVLSLPMPISVNAAYKNREGGRGKTQEALEWGAKARHFALPFIKKYQRTCDNNLLIRREYTTGKKGNRGMKLAEMKADHPALAYQVSYTFNFADDRIRDVFNFEKLLTDLLVECGFILDDNFIIDGRVRWGKINPSAPHVDVEIISLDRRAALGYTDIEGEQSHDQI